MIQKVIANNRLRPEPCKIQGCRAPDVVHGGIRIKDKNEFEPLCRIGPPSYL